MLLSKARERDIVPENMAEAEKRLELFSDTTIKDAESWDWSEEMDWIGLDWIGLDWIGLDWIGLDWIGLD